jgi:hypothetical protein
VADGRRTSEGASVIVQELLDIVYALWSFILGSLPQDSAPPDWLSGGTTALIALVDVVNSMGAWIPLDLMFLMGNLVLASIVFGSSVKLLRILLSLFTGGGGSAS